MKGDDRNTTFFHSLLRHLKAQKPLTFLKINNEVIHDPKVIATYILGYYEQILSTLIGDLLDSALIKSVVPFLVTAKGNGNLLHIPSP